MRENNRNSIEIEKMLPQFTTMNVIDGQAGLMSYSSLIFYSLTIDNILNIIVLLILAGVSIAMLTGENGIISQAQKAKEETERAQSEEEEMLKELDSAIKGNIIFTDEDGKKAVIPKGFYIVPELDNINDGLVISDVKNDTQNVGNQFVWVPVPKFEEFKRYDFQNNKEHTSDYTENSGDGINVDENASESEKEAQEMYKSINDNGGFYIGRYEAGKDGEKAVSKKGLDVYNNIIWGNSRSDETGGAVEKARKFDTENGHSNVTSTLVYGVQWDAIMRWLNEGTQEEKKWITDCTGKGNYWDEDESNNPSKTGSNDNYKIKNIYDLAGNVIEWTMESYSTDHQIARGGHYDNYASICPCSSYYDDSTFKNYQYLGFRIALYL